MTELVPLSLEQNRAIDRIVTDFEKALRSGGAPRIEDVVTAHRDLGDPLLSELLLTELEHFASVGRPPDWAGYAARFPEASGILEELRGMPGRAPGVEPDTPDGGMNESVATDIGNAESAEVLAPLDLSDYVLEERLGKGGQGEVHRARQRSLNRPVAVKLLRSDAGNDPLHVQRFLREARTLAQARHPHVVTIHGLGRLDAGGYFLVMEYVEGPDLAHQLKERAFTVEEAVWIVGQIAGAIEHAHRCGVIHRDLKPANVLWDAHRGPVVTDFGLAKDLRDATDLTLTEQLLGTPGYMAPEQAERRFGDVSERTDVYGLGATMFALLTRRPPYIGTSLADVLHQLTSDGPIPDPSALSPGLPREIAQLCRACLAKSPGARLASAAELRSQLERWSSGLAITLDDPAGPGDASPASRLPVLQTLGKYRLLERLSTDETRQIWKAETPEGETVLLKYLPVEWLADRLKRSQFRQEVLLSTRLKHPCLAAVIETGTADRAEFLALEYIAGESVARRLEQEGPFDESAAAEILRPIAAALQLINQAGVMYRDLRPQNILITRDGKPMLAEIRFSEELPEGDNGTLAGWGPVTSRYYAPELLLGRPADVVSDVYTLGATLYAMVTGHPPFEEAPSDLAAMLQKSEGRYIDPRQYAPRMSDEVVRLIAATLDAAPAKRPQSAEEFARRLAAAVERKPEGLIPRTGHSHRQPDEPIWDDNVQFSAYRPKVVRPETWERLLVFAHLSELPPDAAPTAVDPVEEVRRQAEQVLGSQSSSFLPVTSDSLAPLPRDGELTLVPSGDGLEFNPPFRTFRWTEPVHREEFRFRAAARLDGQRANGRLSVFLGSVLIAEVNLATRVDSRAHLDPENRIARTNRAYRFRRIYACVAPEDEAVAEQFQRYAKAMRDTFLMAQFVSARRSGNQERIRSADVFQLYWSQRAIASADVETDWRYALSLRRPEFVRPLYWEEPLPTSAERGLPTPELLELGFQKIPGTTDFRDEVRSIARRSAADSRDRLSESTVLHKAVRSEPARKMRKAAPSRRTRGLTRSASGSAAASAHLEILSGPEQGRMLRLEKDRITIGRHADCDLRIDNAALSRFQTQVVKEGGRWYVEDLQSRNGTFRNGSPIRGRTALHDGDQIQIANVIIAFREFEPAAESAAPMVSSTSQAIRPESDTGFELDAASESLELDSPADEDFDDEDVCMLRDDSLAAAPPPPEQLSAPPTAAPVSSLPSPVQDPLEREAVSLKKRLPKRSSQSLGFILAAAALLVLGLALLSWLFR